MDALKRRAEAAEQLAKQRLAELIELDHENSRLTAKLRGYVLAGSAKGPGVFKPDRWQIHSARGVNGGIAFRPTYRYPFVVGPDGECLRVEDWATRLPPRVCAVCSQLFVAGRADARTCSSRCRTALHRRKSD
jgi:hypothetical protein